MKNKKALALIISVTLIVSMTLPGTLAVSEDQAAALDGHTLAEEESAAPTSEEPACTCGTETGVHTEACAQYTAGSTSSGRKDLHLRHDGRHAHGRLPVVYRTGSAHRGGKDLHL